MAYKKKTFTEERPALRVPPYSAEAEQAVLGAILLDAPRAMDICAEADVVADSFWISANRTIFETAWRLYGSGKPVDVVTVSEELRVRGELDVVGGVAALERMVEATPAVAHADYYTSILREKHLLRRVISVAENAQEKCYAPDRSVQLIVSETEQEVLAISDTQKDRVLPWKDSVQQTIGKIESVLQRKDGINGISSGFRNLDERLRGLRNAEMIVLAARPSMGKTSLATNIAFNIARAYRRGRLPDGTEGAVQGGVVGFFSLEMSSEQLAARILSEAAEVPSEQIRRGDMTEAEFRRFVEAAKALEACPLYIDDTPALPISQVAARARRLKRTHGLDVLIVDYLQLLRAGSGKANRVQEVSEITQGLKAIAKELNIPVIALSQLSRQVESREDKRPQLSDLRESGSIEQDADVVMFVYREEYYKEREKPGEHNLEAMAKWQETMQRVHGKAEVIIGKQRHGPIGTVELSFEGRFTRFGNLVRPWQDGGEERF
jgi:replicative DNA helicase